jgi:hypothetical protein
MRIDYSSNPSAAAVTAVTPATARTRGVVAQVFAFRGGTRPE